MGDNIFIHGNAVSIGCIAIGDGGINVLFPLAVKLGVNRIAIIIAPRDFRLKSTGFFSRYQPVDAPFVFGFAALYEHVSGPSAG